jgi:Putative Actinobacterial Holin-X, holin superfamily III
VNDVPNPPAGDGRTPGPGAAGPSGGGTPHREGQAGQQGIAAAITEVSERASVLIREEIELAKTEITEKTTRLAKGAIVAIVAGVFFFTALFFVLIGCAWLLYYELPIGNEFTYFWGFFAMAVILVVLGVIAGLLAARAVKAGSPPTPKMAIEEARKIRETVSSSSDGKASAASAAAAQAPIPVPTPAAPKPENGFGRKKSDGTTHGS